MDGKTTPNRDVAKAARDAVGFDACDMQRLTAAATASISTLEAMLPDLMDGLSAGAENKNPENQAYLRSRFLNQLTPEREQAITETTRLAMEKADRRCLDDRPISKTPPLS